MEISDTRNRSVKRVHPDPAAIGSGDWTLMRIPLIDLSDINLMSVNSFTVGVEGVGARGQLYIDYLHTAKEPAPYFGLFAHYALEGDAVDGSGNGFDGVITGAPSFVDGAVGQGLHFTGAEGDDAVTIGTYNPSFVSGQLSISLWAKWNGLNDQWQGLIGKRDNWHEDKMMWDIEAKRYGGDLRFGRKGSIVEIGNIPDPNLVAGEWEHVGVTFDGQTATMYKNGRPTNSGRFSFGYGTATHMQFGCSQQDGRFPFNGALDEIRIYDRALRVDEMAALGSR